MFVTGCHRILGIPEKGGLLAPVDAISEDAAPVDATSDDAADCTGMPVSGVIQDARWTIAGSPYILTGDLSVSSLTIDPGVSVMAAGNFVFEIAGTLSAVGTTSAPIIFTSGPCNTEGWQGLYFNSSQQSELAFATIEKSRAGGIRIQDTSPTIRNCIIRNNTAGQGGGIYIAGPMSAPTVNNCRIDGNIATDFFDAGGGVFVREGSLEVRNSIIVNNRSVYANALGGGLLGCGGQSVLVNTVLAGNGGADFGDGSGGIAVAMAGVRGCVSNVSISIKNSIIFNNVPFQVTGTPVTITYTDVQGGFAGEGNISANPIFLDADYRLSSESACVDAGDPVATDDDTCSPTSGTVRNDMGAYGGPLGCNW
jgi:hypothetical protein